MTNKQVFFDWHIAAEGVAEVSVRDNVDLTAKHVLEAFSIVAEKMPKKFCVLAQRHENYRQSLEAMVALSSLDNVLLYAVYGLNEEQLRLAKTHRQMNPKVRVFTNRQSALAVCSDAYKAYKSA